MVVCGPRSALGFTLAMFLFPTHLDERASSALSVQSLNVLSQVSLRPLGWLSVGFGQRK